jgi:site-specific recombinase XerD
MRTTLKLTEIIDSWIADTDILPATKADYRRKVNLWFRWLAAQGVEPRSPQRHHIVEYKRWLQDEGRSVLTVCSYVTVVKLFYRYCEQMGYYNNIGTGIKSSVKHRAHYKEPLTSTEAARLLESIDTETVIGKRDKLIVALMLTNGLRACEVERIDIRDFDRVGGRTILHIRRKGKVDKHDTVAVPDIITELLEDYISCRDFDTADPLFLNHAHGKKTQRLAKVTISAIVKQRLRDIGIDRPQVTAHSLRHTCGSLLVEQGVDVETIKDMLGHTDTQTTRIYIEMARQKRLLEQSPSNIIAGIITKKQKRKRKQK